MPYECLLAAREGAVLTLTLNRPKVLNALNAQLLGELADAIDQADGDAGVRVLVITGAGDRAFAAGADIGELAALDAAGAREFARRGQGLMGRLESLGKPVIAAINGFALGGGCELAMACTLRLASESAHLGQPEIDLGLIPGFGGTQRLPRLVGRGRALELLLTGRRISAVEAERIGLVNRVVAADSLHAETRTLAEQLAAKAPLAVRYVLDAVRDGADAPLERAASIEAAYFGLAAATEDMREGTAAFLARRAPTFRGR